MEDRAFRFGLDAFKGQELDIWQGTVITNSTEHPRLVLSADCDLLASKSGGIFFYLTVIPASIFVRDYALPDTIGGRTTLIHEAAKELVQTRNPAFTNVSSHVFTDWLHRHERNRWSKDLPGAHPAELDFLEALAKASRDVHGPAPTAQTEDIDVELIEQPASPYIECKNPQQEKKVNALNKKIRELIQSRLQSSRFDHFILPEVPGAAGCGHYVPFRSIRAMQRSHVCSSRTEVIEYKDNFYPIATCRPILMQSLLQKFMTYFMRIGLTDHFKTQQDGVVNETLGGVK